MALQACIRCHKRRTKCDSQLPACASCETADVECLFFDDSLQQQIPRSYLQALQEKTRDLEREIKSRREKEYAPSHILDNEAQRPQQAELDYHLGTVATTVEGQSSTAYIGASSSARLLERLLKGAAQWHAIHKPQTSGYAISPLVALSASVEEISLPPTFPIVVDHRKLDFSSTIPPSTQRSLIGHYLKVVQSKYPLLSAEQEADFVEQENLLRWCMANPHHSEHLVVTAVIAISTALVARDLDSGLSGVARFYGESLQRLTYETLPSTEALVRTSTRTVMALCFCAINELVNPVTGQIWELVGRALAGVEQLRYEYVITSMPSDDEFRRLEFSLLRLESSLSLHFCRPSPYCQTWRLSQLDGYSVGHITTTPLYIYRHLFNIAHAFSSHKIPHQVYMESLIPADLKVSRGDFRINASSAIVYVALHPLFTSCTTAMFSSTPLDENAAELLRIIAESASTIIDGFVKLNKEHQVLSIWHSAERVLQAGAVWATYLISLRCTQSHHRSDVLSQTRTKSSITPLLKCTKLLVSFAERWKDGVIYSQIWETFLSLLWGILD